MRPDLTLAAITDPTRRALLRRLAERPCRATALAEGFPISRPAISKHTRILTRAGLIQMRREGRERIYELAPDGGQAIRELINQLEEVGRFWDSALERFKQYVEGKR